MNIPCKLHPSKANAGFLARDQGNPVARCPVHPAFADRSGPSAPSLLLCGRRAEGGGHTSRPGPSPLSGTRGGGARSLLCGKRGCRPAWAQNRRSWVRPGGTGGGRAEMAVPTAAGTPRELGALRSLTSTSPWCKVTLATMQRWATAEDVVAEGTLLPGPATVWQPRAQGSAGPILKRASLPLLFTKFWGHPPVTHPSTRGAWLRFHCHERFRKVSAPSSQGGNTRELFPGKQTLT